MAMAVPFYIGAYFAIDMFVGTVIFFVWERVNKKDVEDYVGAVLSLRFKCFWTGFKCDSSFMKNLKQRKFKMILKMVMNLEKRWLKEL